MLNVYKLKYCARLLNDVYGETVLLQACLFHYMKKSRIQIYDIMVTKEKVTKEKAMAPHSSTLAWRIPWTEEPGRLQSMGSTELDMTERLHFQFSLACIGEGNGNPLQYSCLETPRDRGAWWAAVYGVTQSDTTDAT